MNLSETWRLSGLMKASLSKKIKIPFGWKLSLWGGFYLMTRPTGSVGVCMASSLWAGSAAPVCSSLHPEPRHQQWNNWAVLFIFTLVLLFILTLVPGDFRVATEHKTTLSQKHSQLLSVQQEHAAPLLIIIILGDTEAFQRCYHYHSIPTAFVLLFNVVRTTQMKKEMVTIPNDCL